jgi:CheY-like chemotaxis protein
MAGLRVVVVEDEALISLALAEMLEELGHQVVGPFATLAKADAAVQSEQFDVALLDIQLGHEEAYPLADILLSRGVPFAFMTGHDTRALPAPYSAVAALAKPYTVFNVAATISKLQSALVSPPVGEP